MTITPEILLHGYASGIFPMAEFRDSDELFWVDPKRRGVFDLNGFHISRSLAKSMRRGGYRIAINQDFSAVVETCGNRHETWINDTLFDLYMALHGRGFAHAFEIRDATDNQLWGGVFGITLGAAFFGESMFSTRTNGSKIALAHLVDHLRSTGFTLFDTQFITDHLASLGATEISRAAYRAQLEDALEIACDFQSQVPEQDPHLVIQRNTQTS